jgi:hypothetical protein
MNKPTRKAVLSGGEILPREHTLKAPEALLGPSPVGAELTPEGRALAAGLLALLRIGSALAQVINEEQSRR